jgi:flagellar basal-body rod modification protein FlgD
LTIGSISPQQPAAVSGNQTSGDQSIVATTAGVDKNMFMQLLVAQLKNQDPLNPTDSTQFVTQLAQFQQLEQSVNTGQDITAILKDLDTLIAAQTPTK